jgi:hypothetical protein
MTTTAPSPPAVRRRLPTWAKVLLWLTGIAVALLGAAALWLAAALAGGLDDLLSLPGPSADDERVVRAQQQAERAMRAEADRMLLTVVEPVLGAAAVASGSESRCEQGQHNWKIDDPYDLRCHQTHVAVVPAGDVPGFRETALALHEALLSDGWEPGTGYGAGSLEDALVEHWDQPPGDDTATPADLPGGSYHRGDRELSVDWVAAGSTHYGWPLLSTEDGRDVPAQEAGRLVADGTWAAALVLRTQYFHE